MVKSIPTLVLPPNAIAITGDAVPGDDEVVAIAAAIDFYMSSGDGLDILESEQTRPVSPWLVASRLEATRTSGSISSPQRSFSGSSLWKNLFSLALIAASLNISCQSAPPALAQSAANSSTNYFGTWNYKDDSQSIRVLIGAPTSKVDLDLPDGGSIYGADGSLVAKVGPRSSWSLNLARLPGATGAATAYGGSTSGSGGYSGSSWAAKTKFVFSGKTNQDLAQSQGVSGSRIQKASFLPPKAARFGENRFALNSDAAAGGYLVVPDAQSTQTAAPLVGVNGKLYRGSLLLKPVTAPITAANAANAADANTTSIAIINIVKIEDYLLSVVPSEVPSLWPQEVLKAQAIAARSYAVANLGKHKVDGYDVKDTVEDQVYKGVVSESNETNVACAGTVGLVLKQNDKVISAFFHSTSGGSTELAENVWSKPLPYLKSVPDFDDAAPLFSWERSFTIDQLNKLLAVQPIDGSGFNHNGDASPDQVSGIFVVSRYKSDAQRVKHLIAVTGNSGRVLTGGEIRKLLNLPSTRFNVYQADGAYVFSGHGFGHGLGLSQWGAKALADKGYNAGQILSYYYKDVTIESMGVLSNGSI